MAATIDEKSDQDQNDEVINILLKARESRGKNLDLSNKILTYVPKLLLSLTHLQYLYLSKNQIQCLPPSFAENLKQLKWLDLRYNNLYELPENISLLTNLKNLLVEGNKIEKLPIKLGLLSNLTGLNLTENPISFPPDDVIKCGTQVVLLFLREQLAIEEKFGSLDIEDERNYASSTDGRNESPINSELDEPETIDRDVNPLKYQHNYRRLSLKENILRSPPYKIDSVKINENGNLSKAQRRRELISAPARTNIRNAPSAKRVRNKPTTYSGYFRNEPFESRYHRELEKCERKKTNEKADRIIQKHKDKYMLEEWRRKSRQLQRKIETKKTKHEIHMPFANELQREQPINGKDNGKKVPNRNVLLREMRGKQLEEKIQEHVRNMQEWRRDKSKLTVQDELGTATRNLNKAIELQKDLEEKKFLEYRLRAFTGEDYAPMSKTRIDGNRKL